MPFTSTDNVRYPLLENHHYYPSKKRTPIPVVIRDELLGVCSRTGNRGLDGIPNKILKLAVKSRLDIFAGLFEV